MQKAALQNVPITTLISQARAQGAVPVQKTLQHVLMHTATTAFSEGAKTTFRHMGQAMNERLGPFSTFFTTNFADTYHVLNQVLSQGAFEPLGRRPQHLAGFASHANVAGDAQDRCNQTNGAGELVLVLGCHYAPESCALAGCSSENENMILVPDGTMSRPWRMTSHLLATSESRLSCAP